MHIARAYERLPRLQIQFRISRSFRPRNPANLGSNPFLDSPKGTHPILSPILYSSNWIINLLWDGLVCSIVGYFYLYLVFCPRPTGSPKYSVTRKNIPLVLTKPSNEIYKFTALGGEYIKLKAKQNRCRELGVLPSFRAKTFWKKKKKNIPVLMISKLRKDFMVFKRRGLLWTDLL